MEICGEEKDTDEKEPENLIESHNEKCDEYSRDPKNNLSGIRR